MIEISEHRSYIQAFRTYFTYECSGSASLFTESMDINDSKNYQWQLYTLENSASIGAIVTQSVSYPIKNYIATDNCSHQIKQGFNLNTIYYPLYFLKISHKLFGDELRTGSFVAYHLVNGTTYHIYDKDGNGNLYCDNAYFGSSSFNSASTMQVGNVFYGSGIANWSLPAQNYHFWNYTPNSNKIKDNLGIYNGVIWRSALNEMSTLDNSNETQASNLSSFYFHNFNSIRNEFIDLGEVEELKIDKFGLFFHFNPITSKMEYTKKVRELQPISSHQYIEARTVFCFNYSETTKSGYKIFLNANNIPCFGWNDGTSSYQTTMLTSSTTVTSGSWHDALIVYNTESVKIYLDSVLCSSASTTSKTIYYSGSAKTTIGIQWNLDSIPSATDFTTRTYPFFGGLSGVRFWPNTFDNSQSDFLSNYLTKRTIDLKNDYNESLINIEWKDFIYKNYLYL